MIREWNVIDAILVFRLMDFLYQDLLDQKLDG